jgi:hypothetical protein
MSKPHKPPPELAISDLMREVEALRAKYGIKDKFRPDRRAGILGPTSQADNFVRDRAGREAGDELADRVRYAGGRPPSDPEDLRSARIGMRIHPDLRKELDRRAREEGLRLSMYIERILIDRINVDAGHPILDKIGRYAQSVQRKR